MPTGPVISALICGMLLPALGAAADNAAAGTAAAEDPYLWLEQVDSPRAMDWVRAENAKTAGVLEQDAHYAPMYKDALTIAQAQDRIPQPRIVGGQIYNFWQDKSHAHGLWRRTTLQDYQRANPAWT
ncbi:MAG: S9 family peptidase, partial [bacterium]